MGNKITRWAKQQLPQLHSTGEKLVLMVLATDADSDGTCPLGTSINTVAQSTELARSTAAKALAGLRHANILEVTEQAHDDGGTANNLYRLIVDGVPKFGTPPVRFSVHPRTENRYTPVPKSGTPSPKIGTPVTCDDAEGVPKSGPPTVSLPPTEVVVPRADARARTPARAHDAREDDHDNPPRTKRRARLDDLNATATRSETRRLIEAWRAEHTVQPTTRLITGMTTEVDKAVRAGHDLDCLAAALREWNARPDLFSPKVLAGLYDDAVSRRNAGQQSDRPLIDDHGFPRIDPQHIPDGYLTRAVVDRILGPDPVRAPLYPPDADHPNGYSGEEAETRARFFADWRETRNMERRAEVRRALLKAWNRRSGAA